MSASLPIILMAAWGLLFGFVNTHQRHASNFRGSSRGFLAVLQASVLLGTLVGLGLLVFYFTRVSWYWPLVLFALGSAVGGLVFGLLDVKLGQLAMSIIAFLGWPAAAIWMYFIVQALPV